MPDRVPASFDDEEDDRSGRGEGFDSADEYADDEDSDSDMDIEEHPCRGPRPQLHTFIRDEIEEMYTSRYEQPHGALPHPQGESQLYHILHTLKNARPDHFCEALRIDPSTFDTLVTQIDDDPIFSNNSRNGQMPVEDQVANTLFRLGHSGNAVSLQNIANWAGCGKGTVDLVTWRVMVAVLQPEFMSEAVRLPTEEEIEQAKRWVEVHSCRGWRNGWCLVDGTLIPLFERPHWYSESYYDRKCNYSLNLQVISLPNLCIIDFSYGRMGSAHDATAWEDTHFAQEHTSILKENEWIWADSAYPVPKYYHLLMMAASLTQNDRYLPGLFRHTRVLKRSMRTTRPLTTMFLWFASTQNTPSAISRGDFIR